MTGAATQTRESTPYVPALGRALETSGRNPQQYLDVLAKGQWIEAKYGRKLELGSGLILIQIDPGKTTAIKDLDAYGLRGHPGTKWEKITLLGYATTTDDTGNSVDSRPTLYYKFRGRYSEELGGKVFTTIGAFFNSVDMDKDQAGYWHENVNISKSRAPIVLLIESQNWTYNEEVARLNVRYEDLEAAVYRNWLEQGAGSILKPEAGARIQKLDAEYTAALVKLDEEQKLVMLRRGAEPMVVIKEFEDKIGAAGKAHAEAVLAVIDESVSPGLAKSLRQSYKVFCIDAFNPTDGMLSRYYVELGDINARYGIVAATA